MLKEAVEEDGGHQGGEEDEGSDVSGYHSDSDSAIMMSGNSPYVSKHARFNFLTRSGKFAVPGYLFDAVKMLVVLFFVCLFLVSVHLPI